MTSFVNDDGQEIQYTNSDLLITKQVASFKNFKIKGDVSISFQVPNTSDNRKALGYYGLNQIGGPTFSQNTFNLVKNGNILMRGSLVIEEDDGKELSLYFISGNANWFRSFEFTCKQINNNGYQVRWTYQWVESTNANTKGIIFPMVDYMFGRQKFDKYRFYAPYIGTNSEDNFNPENLFPNNLPCLYINTLVQEIAKVANIRINGTLLDDKLYQSLIITPESSKLYNSNGLISPFYSDSDIEGALINSMIRIEDIAPDIKAIEIIKYLIFKFGCVPTFDVFSQTLT